MATATGGSSDSLISSLLIASRALVGVSARSLAEVEDTVTPTQFRTLVVLASHGPSRLNQLSQRLGVNASTALRMVDRLIAAGLVQRRENAEDRREVVISLTRAGADLVARVTSHRRRAITKVVRAMSTERREHLVDALEAFAAAAGEPGEVSDAATRLGW